MKQHIVVCVCTRGRPKLFENCFRELLKQSAPAGARLSYLVVENEDAPKLEYLVNTLAYTVEETVFYYHEPRLGVARARNAALKRALELSADWIAFIDDDERPVHKLWLRSLWRALWEHGTMCDYGGVGYDGFMLQKRAPADVACGPVEYEWRPSVPEWRRRRPWGSHGKYDGQFLTFASTNNVLFSADLARSLKFEENLNYSGGEDTAFFLKAHSELGARIVWAQQAAVIETVTDDRASLLGQWRIAFRKGWCKINDVRGRHRKFLGVRRLLSGLLQIAVCPIGGKRRMLSGLLRIAEGAGALTAQFGGSCNYYKRITGS